MATTDALATVLDPQNPTIQQYRQQAPELLEMARALVITTDADLLIAAEHTRLATGAVKAIKALFAPARRALDEAKRQIGGLEQALLDGFEQADGILRYKVTNYRVAQRRRVEADAQRERDAERKRREDAQVDQAARLETLARRTGEDHYQRAAELVLNQPVREPPLAVTVPKVPGISDRVEVGVEIIDLRLLLGAVAAGAVDAQAVIANEPWLRKEARQRGTALRDGDEIFPGVVARLTPGVSVRTR